MSVNPLRVSGAKSIREISEDFWKGKPGENKQADSKNPFLPLEEFEPGLAFVLGFANSLIVNTSEGLVLIDVGNWQNQKKMQATVRQYSKKPLHAAIYTHGHTDHVFGVPLYEKEPGGKRALVIAHKNLPKRFARYDLTNGYNAMINLRQFRLPKPEWPRDWRHPDITYEESFNITIGGVPFELYHARGETDDATWVYLPSYRAIATGDLFIWSIPNCGNPQKAQRYAKDWAEALRHMQGKKAKYLFPGHGVPIIGEDRVQQALGETAEYLESVVSQTLTLMNQGKCLNEILHTVKPPAHLLSRPYLKATYDDHEFITRNIWRLYGGWWDFDPASLKPAPQILLAKEIASLTGGPKALASRAAKLIESKDDNDRRLACHLIEFAKLAVDSDPDSPDRKEVHRIRSHVYGTRMEKETSYMVTGIFRDAKLSSIAVSDPEKLQAARAKL